MKHLQATVFLALSMATANAAAITYHVDRIIDAGTVTGTITTNGALGTLSAGDIEDWTLTLTAPNLVLIPGETSSTISRFGPDGTTFTGNTFLVGDAVSATHTELSFNFDTTNPASKYFFLVGIPDPKNFWCLETGSVCANDTETYAEKMGLNNNNVDEVAQSIGRSGEVVFATAVIPVPAAIWLFGSGLLGLFGLARIRR